MKKEIQPEKNPYHIISFPVLSNRAGNGMTGFFTAGAFSEQGTAEKKRRFSWPG